MKGYRAIIGGIAAAIGAAACSGKTAPPSADLQHDLDLAHASAAQQGATAPGFQIAADEVLPKSSAAPVRATPRRRETPTTRANPAAASVAPATVAETPSAPAASDAPSVDRAPATTRPAPPPAVTPAPRGGYKSMGQIIRNAPFPINP